MKRVMNAIFSWILVGVVSVVIQAAIEKQKLTIADLGFASILGPVLAGAVIIYQIKKNNINGDTCLMNCGDENEQK